MKWRLTGTPSQQAIILNAFDKIKFPWDRLNITWNPELGWRDLNGGFALAGTEPPAGSITDEPKAHRGGWTPEHEGPPEPLNGELEGRRFTMGVFYPGSGRIYIDYRLERYPAMAQATLSAEIAHAVDEFLPLTDAQRDQMIVAMGGTLGEMTWWEKSDYSTEYWTLAGEMFMPAFTDTYSDIPFGDVSSFKVNPRNMSPERLVEIMGITRTDFVAVTPPPPPPPEVVIPPAEEIIPVAEPEPVKEPEPVAPVVVPAPHVHSYVRYGKSKVLHRADHFEKKKNGVVMVEAHMPAGFKACKICKPH